MLHREHNWFGFGASGEEYGLYRGRVMFLELRLDSSVGNSVNNTCQQCHHALFLTCLICGYDSLDTWSLPTKMRMSDVGSRAPLEVRYFKLFSLQD
eukprot:5152479-Amphidinium_carterae.2